MFSRPPLVIHTEEGKHARDNCDRVRDASVPSSRDEMQLLKSVWTRAVSRGERRGREGKERGESDVSASECIVYKKTQGIITE